MGSERSRSSGVCLPCRCAVNRCWDLRGSQTHHKRHIKDKLINAHPDVNYHKTKTLKHWFFSSFFFKYSTSPVPALIFSGMIYHHALFPRVTGLRFMHGHYFDLFRHAKSMLMGENPIIDVFWGLYAGRHLGRTKRGRWKWEVLLTSTPDSCSRISKNSCGRWQVLLVLTHYL